MDTLELTIRTLSSRYCVPYQELYELTHGKHPDEIYLKYTSCSEEPMKSKYFVALVASLLRFAFHTLKVHSLSINPEQMDDFIQAVCIAVLNSCRHYNPDNPAKASFETYACTAIKNAVTNFVSANRTDLPAIWDKEGEPVLPNSLIRPVDEQPEVESILADIPPAYLKSPEASALLPLIYALVTDHRCKVVSGITKAPRPYGIAVMVDGVPVTLIPGRKLIIASEIPPDEILKALTGGIP